MASRSTSIAAAIAIAGLGVVAAGCEPDGSAPPPDHPAGALSITLTATSHGHLYRVRHASFAISGPTTTALDSEAQPDAAVLDATLDVGDYTITLADG